MDTCEPVGVIEIAERLGVTRACTDQWRHRPQRIPFPAPRWTVGGRPCWNWPDIEQWAQAMGKRSLGLAAPFPSR